MGFDGASGEATRRWSVGVEGNEQRREKKVQPGAGPTTGAARHRIYVVLSLNN
jgi:hypothetical protein